MIGSCKLSFEYEDTRIVTDVYFIENVSTVFLSLHTLKKLHIIHPDFPLPIKAGLQIEVNALLNTHPQDYPHASDYQSKVELPFEATEENIPQLKQWLITHFKYSVFNTNRIPFPAMTGENHHIHLKEGATPFAVHSPTPIPCHWRDQVKATLDRMVENGIITPVNVGEPVDWCTRMVSVAKKDGTPRITVDFQELNKNVKRETHYTPYPFNTISTIPIHSYKTVLDAKDGYLQVELDKESSLLTTFICMFGRYRFL